MKILPSILAADYLRLGEQIAEAERGGADRFHIDVMDGLFVPNISLGIPVVEAVRRGTKLPLEIHLMIERPERYTADFAKAGGDLLILHQEATPNLHRALQQVRQLGKQAGVGLNPATPLGTVEDVIEGLDLLLLMTVNPGFGGQKFIPAVLFLVAGADKEWALHQVLQGGASVADVPARGVRPATGALTFLVDRAAAAGLVLRSA